MDLDERMEALVRRLIVHIHDEAMSVMTETRTDLTRDPDAFAELVADVVASSGVDPEHRSQVVRRLKQRWSWAADCLEKLAKKMEEPDGER